MHCERLFVRKFPAVLLLALCSCVALLGAGRPTPTPSPSPTASAAAPRALPLIVVFPFGTSTDLKPGVGQNAAQLFVQQMNADGGIDAIAAASSVKRTDFLKYAQGVDADYYISGYMTPLGNGVSLVEQVVSTRSGTIVYGQTAQIESFQDATAQATIIHDGILTLEKQTADAYNGAQAQATATPMAKNQANLSKGLAGLAGLFKHKAKETPAPAAAKPPKRVLVVRIAGALPSADLAKGTSTLVDALNAHYNVRMTNAAPRGLSQEADGICGTDRNNTIASGTASAKLVHHGLGSRPEYTFVLDVYTCFGAKLAQNSGTGDSLASAVRTAVDAYATAHPQNG